VRHAAGGRDLAFRSTPVVVLAPAVVADDAYRRAVAVGRDDRMQAIDLARAAQVFDGVTGLESANGLMHG
jgi:hypothetical protein